MSKINIEKGLLYLSHNSKTVKLKVFQCFFSFGCIVYYLNSAGTVANLKELGSMRGSIYYGFGLMG